MGEVDRVSGIFLPFLLGGFATWRANHSFFGINNGEPMSRLGV
jgi:hypothetical protein